MPTVVPSGEWFDNGTSLTLTAQSISGYVFDHWAVDGVARGSGVATIQITIDSARTATAYYVSAPPAAQGAGRVLIVIPVVAIVGVVVLLVLLLKRCRPH